MHRIRTGMTDRSTTSLQGGVRQARNEVYDNFEPEQRGPFADCRLVWTRLARAARVRWRKPCGASRMSSRSGLLPWCFGGLYADTTKGPKAVHNIVLHCRFSSVHADFSVLPTLKRKTADCFAERMKQNISWSGQLSQRFRPRGEEAQRKVSEEATTTDAMGAFTLLGACAGPCWHSRFGQIPVVRLWDAIVAPTWAPLGHRRSPSELHCVEGSKVIAPCELFEQSMQRPRLAYCGLYGRGPRRKRRSEIQRRRQGPLSAPRPLQVPHPPQLERLGAPVHVCGLLTACAGFVTKFWLWGTDLAAPRTCSTRGKRRSKSSRQQAAKRNRSSRRCWIASRRIPCMGLRGTPWSCSFVSNQGLWESLSNGFSLREEGLEMRHTAILRVRRSRCGWRAHDRSHDLNRWTIEDRTYVFFFYIWEELDKEKSKRNRYFCWPKGNRSRHSSCSLFVSVRMRKDKRLERFLILLGRSVIILETDSVESCVGGLCILSGCLWCWLVQMSCVRCVCCVYLCFCFL